MQLMPIFLCLSRLMVVLHPMSTEFKRPNFVATWLVSISCLSLILTISATLVMKIFYQWMPFYLCVPAVDPSGSNLFVKGLTIFLFCLFLSSSFSQAMIHLLLMYNLHTSRQNIKNSMLNKKKSDKALMFQLLMLWIFHTTVWFSVGGIFLFGMAKENFSISLIVWTICTIYPMESMSAQSVFITMCLRKLL